MNKKKYNNKRKLNLGKELCDKSEIYCSKASQTETGLYNYSKCGEIFLTLDNELLLNCNFCNKNCKVLNVFWDHLLEDHTFITHKIKLENPLKDESLTETSDSDIAFNVLEQKPESSDESNSPASASNIKDINKKVKDYHLQYEELQSSNNNTNEKYSATNNILGNDVCKYPEQQVPKGYWQCDICQLILKRGQERKLHQKTHKGVKRLICETCGKGYTSRNRLLDHIRTHTGEKPFKCRFCPKTFFSHSSMKSHDKTHIGFKPFKCEYCDHYFKTKLNKQIHENKHHNKIGIAEQSKTNSNVICKLCNKSFKCADYLMLHLKRHEEKLAKSSPKPFECTFCPSTFISNVNRNAHERLYHKGEYNYKCDFCGKGFLKLNKKRQHEEMHTRVENPYKCDLCECEYARPEGLKKHKIAKHTKDSPYKCKICQIGFESIILFREHCKQHNVEEKLHGCSLCEARFDTQIRLNRHMVKMHTVDETQIIEKESKDKSELDETKETNLAL